MKRLLLLAAVLLLAPIPAHADTPPCSPIAGDVTQVPNGIEHRTKLHTTVFTTTCAPRTYAQIRGDLQQLQPDGTWATIATGTSPVKYISPYCRNSGCRTVNVQVERDPCISGTFRAVATNSAGTNIGPVATLVCYSDPPQ